MQYKQKAYRCTQDKTYAHIDNYPAFCSDKSYLLLMCSISNMI